eukprot:15362206-Ditylum_brightwellii.AAC.1
MAQCTLAALVRNANTAMSAQSASSFVPPSNVVTTFSPSCRAGRAAHSLSELLMHSLQQFREFHTVDASIGDLGIGTRINDTMISMLDDLQCASAWLFSITHPSVPIDMTFSSTFKNDVSTFTFTQSQAYNIGILLRQGLFASALLLIPEDPTSLTEVHLKRYNKICMETEAMVMKSSSSQDNLISSTMKVCYRYSFEGVRNKETTSHTHVKPTSLALVVL